MWEGECARGLVEDQVNGDRVEMKKETGRSGGMREEIKGWRKYLFSVFALACVA
jgi:hypothetical protein